MKKTFLILIFTFSINLWSQSQMKDLNALQISQIERGYGMFIHFGINTFNEIEWSKGNLPVSSYNPTNLDCDQWIKVAKYSGYSSFNRTFLGCFYRCSQ